MDQENISIRRIFSLIRETINLKGLFQYFELGKFLQLHLQCALFEVFECDRADIISPDNGAVSVNGSTLGSVATFTCNDSYTLIGDATRTCQLTGWSGSNPSCGKLIVTKLVHLLWYRGLPLIRPPLGPAKVS